MMRTIKATALAALCCAVAGAGLVACEESDTAAGKTAEGASDEPAGLQRQADIAKVLTAVLDRVAGGGPAVLAGPASAPPRATRRATSR